MTNNKKTFEKFKKYFTEELEKIKRSNYNKYLELLYLIEKYQGLVLFKLPVEDCAPQDRMYPELQYLFLDLSTAFKSENFINKVDILCKRISEEKTNNLILLNNPRFHDYKIEDLNLFKKVFKKLIEVYSEEYGIEVILVDLESFMETKVLKQNEFSLSLFPLNDEDIEIDFKGKYLFKNYMYCDDDIKHTIKRIFIDCLENKIKTICIYSNTPNVKSEDEKIKLERFVNTVLLFIHKYKLIYNVNVKLLKKTN